MINLKKKYQYIRRNKLYERALALIGEDNLNKIKRKNILVLGTGGVGGYAIETLVRSGIQNITIVDYDKIDSSNINRQVIANSNNIGNYKGNTYGKCMLFIWNGYGPVVMIKGDNKIVFVNYKEDGAALKLYEQLSGAGTI